MKIQPLVLSVCLTLAVGISSAYAGPVKHGHRHAVFHPTVIRVAAPKLIVKPIPLRTTLKRIDSRMILALPAGYKRVVHNDETYFYHDGNYYQRRSQEYALVNPLAGVRLLSLPKGYVSVRMGGGTFYRYRDITYRKSNGFFIVV